MSQVSAVRDRKLTALDVPANPVAIDYPDLVEVGDLLLVQIASGISNQVFTVTGWTSLERVAGGSGLSGEVFYRTATGGEAGSTFDISQSTGGQDIMCIVYAVRGDLNPGTPEAATSTANDALFDPPNLAPSGGDSLYLWLVTGAHRFGNRKITVWDATLSERIQREAAGVACNATGSERLLSAASFDPDAMTVSSGSLWGAWTIAVPVDQPPAGNFPVVETTSQGSWPVASTSQTMTLPAGVAEGDLLVATIAANFDGEATITGWDQLETLRSEGSAGDVTGTVLQREADGTEGASATVTLTPSRAGSFICRRISGADATKTDSVSEGSSGSPIVITWPSLTPTEGAEDILWLCDVANDGTRFLIAQALNGGADPLSEQDGNTGTESTGGGVLARNATSFAPDPGLLNLAEDWVSFTVAVYTDGGPTPPPTPSGNRMGGTGAIRKPPRTPR